MTNTAMRLILERHIHCNRINSGYVCDTGNCFKAGGEGMKARVNRSRLQPSSRTSFPRIGVMGVDIRERYWMYLSTLFGCSRRRFEIFSPSVYYVIGLSLTVRRKTMPEPESCGRISFLQIAKEETVSNLNGKKVVYMLRYCHVVRPGLLARQSRAGSETVRLAIYIHV